MDFWLKELSKINAPAELPEIKLTRAKDGKTFKGPGSVARDPDGQLRLKLYSPGEFKDGFGLIDLPPGTVIPRQDLFDLEAVDMHGHPWRSYGIWPHANVSLPTGTAVVEGKVDRLVGSRSPFKVEKSHLSMMFHTDCRFPVNQRERTERRIGDKLLSANYSRSAAELEAGGLKFRLFRNVQQLVAQVAGDWASTEAEGLAVQVASGLQFMLGCRLQADAFTLTGVESQTQIVQSVARDRRSSRIEPPRNWGSGANEGLTWEIFKSFLEHVRAAPSAKARELCRWTAEVIDTGRAPLEVSSLVLCVAVEGIVGLLQGKESTDTALLADIKRAHDVASSAEFPAGLKPRIIGAILAMKQLRARDYLEQLVDKGAISTVHVEAWKSLRNASAHADASDGDWIVPTVRKSSVVLALYYQLVFMLIGYRGPYTDYSQIGWPERSFGPG
jgi:hypothetical protein